MLHRGILPVIPPLSNRKAPVHPDYRRHEDRNRIERMFGKLEQQRRIAIRYDKAVLSFESVLNLAAARLCASSTGSWRARRPGPMAAVQSVGVKPTWGPKS
ncbi:hypothetical protein DB459_02070 [Bradyrhizobium sp. WD16]|nr:hypothetical protein DB459_02070 [Bradyrhizobium sp. WD16]